MMRCLRWREWRVKNQVCFLIIMESLLIFIAVIALELVNIQQLLPRLQEISKEIALYQIQKQLNIQSEQYAQLVQFTVQRSSFRTITLNTLYQYQSLLLDIQEPYDCLFGERDQYSWTASYCFKFFGIEENSAKVTQLKRFTSLATQTLFMQDSYIEVLFLSLDQSLYYSRYTGKNLTGYDPQQRPWYRQFLTQSNPILISKPYLTFRVNDYVFSLSIFLSDIGMITSEFHFSNINFQTQDSLTKVSMMDDSGLIYFSSNQENIGTNIMQQGYTSESLQKIIQSRSDQLKLNCPFLKDIFCLVKENGDMEIIVTNDLRLQDIFLILQYSPTDYINQINLQLELIYERLYMLFLQYTIIYVVLRMGAIMIYLLTFNNFMLIPLEDIIAHSKNEISKLIKTFKPKSHNKDNILADFRKAYDKFVNQFTYRQRKTCFEVKSSNKYLFQKRNKRDQQLLNYLLLVNRSFEFISEENEEIQIKENQEILYTFRE